MPLDTLKNCGFPFFPYDNITFISEIGRGANGIVYKVKYNNELYAIKEYNSYDWNEIEDFFKVIIYELNIAQRIKSLNHSVNTYGYSYKILNDNIQIFIIMELVVSVGDLFDYSQKSIFWKIYNNEKGYNYITPYVDNNKKRWIYIMDILQKKEVTILLIKSLIELHLKNIIHADIKSDNIIYTLKKNIKIVDFGASYISNKELIDIECKCGTDGYTAPEQYSNKLSKKSDVYSIVITIIEFWNGEIWGDGNSYHSCRKEVLNALNIITKNHPNFANVLKQGIHHDYKKRPSSIKLLHNVKKAFMNDRI